MINRNEVFSISLLADDGLLSFILEALWKDAPDARNQMLVF
jgi:hypothetical protein